MIQKTFVPLRFYAFYSASKVGATGLTVTVTIYENSVAIVTGAAATEIAGGLYSYTLASGSVDANGEYAAIFHTATTTVDAQDIPSMWTTPAWIAELSAILSAVSLGAVTYGSPYNPTTQKLTLTRGDDYRAGVPGAIPPFTSSNWPNLTGATVRFTIRLNPAGDDPDDVLLSMTDTPGVRVVGTGLQSVTVEPLARPGSPVVNAQVGGTHYLIPGRSKAKWDIEATLADTSIKTLASGLMDVVEDQTRDVAP